MSRLCAACGKPIVAGIQIGGVLLCSGCDPIVAEEIALLRAEGKPVNARHIAMRLFRQQSDPQQYLYRDIPGELWSAAQHAATERGVSLRELLTEAIRQLPEVQTYLAR
jgi:hypothetical protein